MRFLEKYMRCLNQRPKKMLKLKALKPSQREKKRYLVYEVEGLEKTSMYEIQNKLITKLNEMLGVYDASIAGIQALKYNNEKRRGILRINNKIVEKVRGIFVLIKKLDGQAVVIKTVGLSGSMKQAKEKFLEKD